MTSTTRERPRFTSHRSRRKIARYCSHVRSDIGSTPFQVLEHLKRPTGQRAAVATTVTMVRLTMTGRTPLEERREAEGKQRKDVDEPAMAVACAELPVPPAGDEIGVQRQDDHRAGKERQLLPVTDDEAGDGPEQKRRPEEQTLLHAEEHAPEMRRRKREARDCRTN